MTRLQENTFERIARILSAEYGLKVRFQGVGASVNLTDKVMTLPSLAEPSPRLKAVIDGFVDHEVGHLKYTQRDMNLLAIGRDKLVLEIFRQIEDVRINTRMGKWKVGCKENIERVMTIARKEKREHLRGKGVSLEEKALWAIYFLWEGTLLESDMSDPFIAEVVDRIRPLVPKVARLRNSKGALSLAKEAAKLLRDLEPPLPPPPPPMSSPEECDDPSESDSDKGDSGDSGNSEDSDESEDSEDTGKSEDSDGSGSAEDSDGSDASEDSEDTEKSPDEDDGEEKRSDGDEDGSEGSDSPESGSKDSPEDGSEDGDDSKDSKDGEGGDGGRREDGEEGFGDSEEEKDSDGFGGDPAGGDGEDMEAPPGERLDKALDKTDKVFDQESMLEEVIVALVTKELEDDPRTHKPFSTQYDVVEESWRIPNIRRHQFIVSQVRATTAYLRRKLEMVLVAKEQAKWLSERERGKLDNRMLHKVLTGTSRTPFKEKVQAETRNVAISLVVDISGSMARGFPSKDRVARDSAAAFSLALTQLGIDHEVVAFSTSYNYSLESAWEKFCETASREMIELFTRTDETLYHVVAKPFGSDKADFSVLQAMANNVDGESLMWAARRLAMRKEPKKVMIVLSDGMPAAHSPLAVLERHLREVVQEINQAGIHTIGIGIQTKAVSLFYPDYIVVNKVEDLQGTVLGQLEKILVQGITAKSLRKAA